MYPLREAVNSDAVLRFRLNNNLRGRVKTLINYPLLFNQCHVVNHLLKPLMCLMIMGDTNKPMMDQLLYHVYKTDNHMAEHTTNLNNTVIFLPEGFQVPEIS